MHRNTYLVVGILAVLAALVVGVNVGKKLGPSTTAPTPSPATQATPTPLVATTTPYVDTACGFSISYPNQFSLMENATGSAILRNTNDQSQVILMTCQKDIPRPALPAGQIEPFSVPTATGATISGKLYHDQSSKDGTPIDALIFTHPTKKTDVFIAGYGTAFNALLKTVLVTQ